MRTAFFILGIVLAAIFLALPALAEPEDFVVECKCKGVKTEYSMGQGCGNGGFAGSVGKVRQIKKTAKKYDECRKAYDKVTCMATLVKLYIHYSREDEFARTYHVYCKKFGWECRLISGDPY